MSKPVKLSEIIDGMESQTDEGRCFLNIGTGEIIGIPDYEFRDEKYTSCAFPVKNFYFTLKHRRCG